MRFPARFPWRWGAHDNTIDVEHQALLDALADGWDTAEGTELWIEARTDALAVTMVWAINRRVGNQGFPLKMLDVLADWEEATNLRPSLDDTMVERRRSLAAKLRGIINNAIGDLEDAAQAALGHNFEALVTVPPSDEITYWDGVNPGPPGYEFSSNRAHICVRANKNGMTEPLFRRKVEKLADTYDHMRPSWLTYEIGVGTAFIVGQSIVGQDLL